MLIVLLKAFCILIVLVFDMAFCVHLMFVLVGYFDLGLTGSVYVLRTSLRYPIVNVTIDIAKVVLLVHTSLRHRDVA